MCIRDRAYLLLARDELAVPDLVNELFGAKRPVRLVNHEEEGDLVVAEAALVRSEERRGQVAVAARAGHDHRVMLEVVLDERRVVLQVRREFVPVAALVLARSAELLQDHLVAHCAFLRGLVEHVEGLLEVLVVFVGELVGGAVAME